MKINEQHSDFFERVYDIVRLIPYGRVTSYGAIAKALGTPSSSRVVGWAMNAAHSIPDIPAHRVVNRNGLLTGKMHFATPDEMQKRLEHEGLVVEDNGVVNFKRFFWDPITELVEITRMQTTLETNRENLKKVLKQRWDIEADYWCPIDEVSTKEEIVYFPQHYFFNDFGLENLKSVVSEISIGNLYQWNWETYKEQFYLIKVEEMVEFNNLEKFYFDDSCDWIVYISHENTISFGGKKLIETLVGKWGNWFKYLNK